MGRLEGKVAFITGAARGQGRSHAVRMAQEGADIIAIDIEDQMGTVPYDMATPADMAETVRQIEALDRRIIASKADVRDFDAVKAALDDGVAQLGKLDIVSANAGIFSFGTMEELTDLEWDELQDVNLKGVWHTAKAAIPHLRANGGGAMILTSSSAGVKAVPNIGHYVAAKHGVIGLMKTLALELAGDMIRVNTVNPTSVDTDMIQNAATAALFAPDLPVEERTREVLGERFKTMNAIPIPWVEAVDISNAVLFLASDEARYITGVVFPIDAGQLVK
ncbi:mycofactocin-coupled SDR family oxidoreductase [Lacisediminihabitans changchengi]|uniref:Mycofactocin-coupled SDR family oxidoreductase n=1 Tax=Lacisediminihabitans changchengi TaxID=2787634 RepID=A0A934STB4_9MICO|nr:mycofactocin-coupled SDR family oxidoreductase [Lacisediminihabitans changchengi]MBK4348560.1 mycofactocin-coupled SDR family oxidoreductase [Lacisediminihabitans changchengi]